MAPRQFQFHKMYSSKAKLIEFHSWLSKRTECICWFDLIVCDFWLKYLFQYAKVQLPTNCFVRLTFHFQTTLLTIDAIEFVSKRRRHFWSFVSKLNIIWIHLKPPLMSFIFSRLDAASIVHIFRLIGFSFCVSAFCVPVLLLIP